MKDNRKIILWLHLCCFMVFTMAVIGAVTRLTESGLSITQWKPVTGTLPPLSEEAWLAEFELYKQSPEFQKKHFWMELDDFKKIFFWEWLHRLWGRLIGLVFALPLLWFWVRKEIPPGYGRHFIGLLCLGGLQGFMGWYMVKSGLVDDPRVSHFRLAAHLSLAFIIFAWMWWLSLFLKAKNHTALVIKPYTRAHGWAALALLAITIIWGAFTAGLDAGMVYNTWPKMNEHWIPPEFTAFHPVWYNAIETPAAVQFIHRCLATITLIVIAAFALRMRDFLLLGGVFLQFGLGIATILTQVMIPVAAMHQAGALILLALLVKALFRIRRSG